MKRVLFSMLLVSIANLAVASLWGDYEELGSPELLGEFAVDPQYLDRFNSFDEFFQALYETGTGFINNEELKFVLASLEVMKDINSKKFNRSNIQDLNSSYSKACKYLDSFSDYVQAGILDELINYAAPSGEKVDGLTSGDGAVPLSNIPKYMSGILVKQGTTNEIDYIVDMSDKLGAGPITRDLRSTLPDRESLESALVDLDPGKQLVLRFCLQADLLLGAFGNSNTYSFSLIDLTAEELRKARLRYLGEELNR